MNLAHGKYKANGSLSLLSFSFNLLSVLSALSLSLLAPSHLESSVFLFNFSPFNTFTPAGTAIATAILEIMAKLHFVLRWSLMRKRAKKLGQVPSVIIGKQEVKIDIGVNLKFCAPLLSSWWSILTLWMGKLTPAKSLLPGYHSSQQSNSCPFIFATKYTLSHTPVPSGAHISEKVSAHTHISFPARSPFHIPLPTSLLSHPHPQPPHSESTEMLPLLPFLPLLLLSTLFHSVLCSEQFSLSQSSDFHFTFLAETNMAYFFLFRLPKAEITVPAVPVPPLARDIWKHDSMICDI